MSINELAPSKIIFRAAGYNASDTTTLRAVHDSVQFRLHGYWCTSSTTRVISNHNKTYNHQSISILNKDTTDWSDADNTTYPEHF